MIFVHSFWSKPLLNNKFDDFSRMLPVVLSNYAYSAACIKHQGHQIKLYTDNYGKNMLSFIGYDEIIVLDNLENEKIHFAAQIKFEALKRMPLNEYLIDGDLFLRKKEIFDIIESVQTDFLYSFWEPNFFVLNNYKEDTMRKYNDIIKNIKKHKDKFVFPYTFEEDIHTFEWPNTSFMHFGNQQLKDEYIKQYEHHKSIIENEDFIGWPDIIIEQSHMKKLLNFRGYKSRPILFGFPSKETNDYAFLIGFCHLGAEKVNLMENTFEWLRQLDEPLFFTVLEKLKKYEEK